MFATPNPEHCGPLPASICRFNGGGRDSAVAPGSSVSSGEQHDSPRLTPAANSAANLHFPARGGGDTIAMQKLKTISHEKARDLGAENVTRAEVRVFYATPDLAKVEADIQKRNGKAAEILVLDNDP